MLVPKKFFFSVFNRKKKEEEKIKFQLHALPQNIPVQVTFGPTFGYTRRPAMAVQCVQTKI